MSLKIWWKYRVKPFWRGVGKGISRSWTMHSIWILAFLGVIETQFELLRPYLSEKAYGAAYFTALVIVALARLRGIKEVAGK